VSKNGLPPTVRLGDVAVFENRQPVIPIAIGTKFINKSSLFILIAWRYSSAGTEAD
jgi:hypothetical protein